MVNKTCSWGQCNSDSRYAHKDYMNGVNFVKFPNPKHDIEKCKRWVNACYRKKFNLSNVTRHSYICTKHFVGDNGPTEKHLDPINAGFTAEQVCTFACRFCGKTKC